jgi:hypothetical protein
LVTIPRPAQNQTRIDKLEIGIDKSPAFNDSSRPQAKQRQVFISLLTFKFKFVPAVAFMIIHAKNGSTPT